MSDQPMSMYGAVDLGALAAQRQAAADAATAAEAAPVGVIKDVTTASFQDDVLEQSKTVPVVIDLWAEWCGPCKQLTPVLEKLAGEYAGRFVLAKVDVDAEQQIAAAFQVQSIPSVFAVLAGQPLPLFQGALPEQQVRQVVEALLAEASKAGVTGTVGAGAAPEPAPQEEAAHPGHDAAYEAVQAGNWDAARAAYQSILDSDPADPDAAAGLRLVALYERTDGLDPEAVLRQATSAPEDIDAQFAAADMEALQGLWQPAFDRLIVSVRRSAGDDRTRVRDRLVELFEIAGPEVDAVAKGRVALANALF